jgi:hypothetical protein
VTDAQRPAAARKGEALESASAPWHSLSGWQHALVLCLLAAATLVRFPSSIASPSPLGDEIVHEIAYRLEASGRSPYVDGDYVYPPSLLRIGTALRALPLPSPFLPLRAASVAGLALILWSAAAWLPLSIAGRIGACVLAIAAAPGIRQGIELGNLSFAVGGLIVAGLLGWRRAPVGSGLALGASLLVKPLAPAALVALFCHRPGLTLRHRLAGAVAATAAAAALLSDPAWRDFLEHSSRTWVLGRTASVHRFLALANLPAFAKGLALLLLLAVAVAAWRRVHDRPQLLALALAGCVTVTPVVWNHTLVLTLPLQAMAVTLALARLRAAKAADHRWRRWEAVAIALAWAALLFGEGATGIDDRGTALQIFATLPPALAPAVLAAYVLRFHSPTSAASPAPRQTP